MNLGLGLTSMGLVPFLRVNMTSVRDPPTNLAVTGLYITGALRSRTLRVMAHTPGILTGVPSLIKDLTRIWAMRCAVFTIKTPK